MKTLAGSPGAILATGAATAAECLRYAMSLPVATVCSGMDSLEKLRQNIAVARSFTSLKDDERLALLSRTQELGDAGHTRAVQSSPALIAVRHIFLFLFFVVPLSGQDLNLAPPKPRWPSQDGKCAVEAGRALGGQADPRRRRLPCSRHFGALGGRDIGGH